VTATRRRPYRPDPEALASMAWTHPWTPTEAEVTDLFLDVARACHWGPMYHTFDARRSEPGFPDWVLVNVKQRRVIFVELKGFAGIATWSSASSCAPSTTPAAKPTWSARPAIAPLT